MLMVGVIALPLIFQKGDDSPLAEPDDFLIVLSPHTEFICDEFAAGFSKWYYKKTGRSIMVDFRHIGGTTETQRYLDTVYDNAFRRYWEDVLKKPWSYEVQVSYSKPLKLPNDPKEDTLAQAARRAFLEAPISCGVDVLFGGGSLAFDTQAAKGQFLRTNLIEKHPEWFTEDIMPAIWAGDHTRDEEGLWFGAVFSSYGILFNKDSLAKVGFEGEPDRWQHLTDGRFFGQVALSDPNKSGAAKKAFELIVQEQMQLAQRDYLATGKSNAEAELFGIQTGWVKGLNILQKMAANARYFTDKSTKPAVDVSSGDCTLGVLLDGYGLAQRQNIIDRGGEDRLGFLIPTIGSTLEPDPIAVLKGAPHPELAELFVEFVLSLEGQKIWAYQAGTPDGPQHFTLRRLSVRKDIYTPEHFPFMADSSLNPYSDPSRYIYHPDWTGPIFPVLHYVIKALCIDPHMELQAAWGAILEAQQDGRLEDAQAALVIFEDLNGLSYDMVRGPFRETLATGSPLQAIMMQSVLTSRFVDQYRRAYDRAKGWQPRR